MTNPVNGVPPLDLLLLRECQHRMSNDLQVISSMLNRDARHLLNLDASSPAPAMMQAIGDHVQLVASIQRRLCSADGMTAMSVASIGAGIEALGRDLATLHDPSNSSAQRVVVASDAVRALDARQASLVFLIVAELVTNSLKHARGTSGSISVELKSEGSGVLALIVRDEAVEASGSVPPLGGSGNGTHIVRGLAERLGGSAEWVGSEVGMTASILFPAADRRAENALGEKASRRAPIRQSAVAQS